MNDDEDAEEGFVIDWMEAVALVVGVIIIVVVVVVMVDTIGDPVVAVDADAVVSPQCKPPSALS